MILLAGFFFQSLIKKVLLAIFFFSKRHSIFQNKPTNSYSFDFEPPLAQKMALSEKQKELLMKRKIQAIYEKRAKVELKDLELLIINLVFLVLACLLIPCGAILVGVFLGSPLNGKDAASDIIASSSGSGTYWYFVAANIGAIGIGMGVFALILSSVGFVDDYVKARKRAVEKLVREDQENAAKKSNPEIIQ